MYFSKFTPTPSNEIYSDFYFEKRNLFLQHEFNKENMLNIFLDRFAKEAF